MHADMLGLPYWQACNQLEVVFRRPLLREYMGDGL